MRLPNIADDRDDSLTTGNGPLSPRQVEQRELPEAHTAQTVLLDDFGGDFGQHAAEAMALARFRCTRCDIDLSAAHLRRFLHVHHKEVVKYDNPLSELVVLCIGCHANQSGHELMRALLDFSEFSVLARG